MPETRRGFLCRSGAGLLTFCVGGGLVEMTAGEARAEGVAMTVLSNEEAAALEALGDTLLPGAANAGIAHFVDNQLGKPVTDQLLMGRYVGVDASPQSFYQDALAALDGIAVGRYDEPFAGLQDEKRQALVQAIALNNPEGWDGPPAPLFYFVVRSDAVDVVYGTISGVERLGIPYMAHIVPPSRWGES